MIAQLSPSAPLGSPSSSNIGVRCTGYLARNSGVVVLPHTSTSSKSRPAARTKIRALRLLTLGLRMLSVFAAMCSSRTGWGLLGDWFSERDSSGRRGFRASASARDKLRLVRAALQASPRHELDARLDDEHVPKSLTDRLGERVGRARALGEL